MKNIHIITAPGVVEDYVLRILARKLREREVALADESGPDTLDLELTPVKLENLDSFKIEKISNEHFRIVGDGQRGLIYGIGRFLRECEFGNGEFTPCSWTGISVPAKPVRGMYFATHFHNFYHEAPVEIINEYVEDLALWGCNAINVWYDMHHYTGINDPEAQKMIERLKIILKAAKRIGLHPCIGTLANEAYSTTPEHLKSIPPKSAHYGVEICPSKPGGMELIIQLRREMLEAFKEAEPEIFWIWPYDQGGCACDECMPWGYKGFLKSGKAVAELVRELYPSAKTVVSTWCFDYFVEGEYAGFQRAVEAGEMEWADYLMIDAHDEFPPYIRQHGVPGGKPALGFPEISMYCMYPWGGFGANPMPNHIQEMWDTSGHLLAGGFPYSEGIFEDLNKTICLQLYWDPAKRVSKTVEEYARYELGADPEAIRIACSLMESDHYHLTNESATPVYRMEKTENTEECYAVMQRAAQSVAKWAEQSWRWRILYIRANMDVVIAKNPSPEEPEIDAMFEELSDIYYAESAEFTVCPPSKRHLQRIFGNK